PLGGFLIDALDWRAVFWINLPLSVVAIWLALRYIPESRNEYASGALDWIGGISAIVAFGALTGGLTLFSEAQIDPAWAFAMMLLGATVLGYFLFVEARASDPLMPLTLFRDRGFSSANIVTVFLYGALTGILFLLPFDLIERRGLSATEVGLTLLPIGVIIGILSRVAGGVADRNGPRLLLVSGSLLVAASAAILAFTLENFWVGVMAPIVLVSLGMAVVVAPLTTAVMNAASEEQSGAASGVNNAASRLAALFAVASFGAIATYVFFASLESGGLTTTGLRFGVFPPAGDPDRPAVEAAFVSAYSAALWATALSGLLAALIALTFLKSDRPHAR
ncbi:MAG: MFS transporter, partial [Pseudomonadota bacterium]